MNDVEKEIKKLKSEYHKQWRAKNKDKIKEINHRYWLKKLERELEKKGKQ